MQYSNKVCGHGYDDNLAAKALSKRESKNAKQIRNTKQNFFTLVCVTPKQ